jgi:hydrogenase maturation protease
MCHDVLLPAALYWSLEILMNQLEPILVLGIGNYLMGDEGVGVHAIRRLQQESFPPQVHLLDGGTGGFHLLSYFQEYRFLILIDATMDGHPPGTVRVIQPRFASDFPKALSSHDIGLRDLIESSALLGTLPRTHLITVSIHEIQSMNMTLSPLIQSSLDQITAEVHRIIHQQTSASSI